MTVICGTDFSDNAAEAATAAAAIAQRLGEKLELVHVVPSAPPLIPAPPAQTPRPEVMRALSDLAEKLREQTPVTIETVALVGAPDDVLLEEARRADASLVVVSSLGARRQRGWLVGSVAERVAQCSTVPVLVVRDASAIVAWAKGERPLEVLVGASLDSTSKAALHWAAELRRIGPCNITVAEVVAPLNEHARLGRPTLAAMDRLRPDIEATLLRDLRRWAGTLREGGETTFVVLPGWGRVDTHLGLLAAEKQVDLLVVGTHQRACLARFWQGSISRGVIHSTAANVACIPPAGVALEPAITTFQSVLVPTDFSSLSNRAIPVAYGLVPEGGVVHLLHVRPPGVRDGQPSPREQLRTLVPPGAAARGISTELHVIADHEPYLGIWHLANRLGVDAICMATHGRSGSAAVVLGSQALEVVRRARQPVILVPPERPA